MSRSEEVMAALVEFFLAHGLRLEGWDQYGGDETYQGKEYTIEGEQVSIDIDELERAIHKAQQARGR